MILIHLSGDIEKNPSPEKDFSQTLSIGHWNLSSVVKHFLTKITLIKAYIFVQKFEIFCISETYNNPGVPEDCDNLQMI